MSLVLEAQVHILLVYLSVCPISCVLALVLGSDIQIHPFSLLYSAASSFRFAYMLN